MKLLTNEEQESYEKTNICEETFEDKYANDKKYRKIRDHCHDTGKKRSAAYSIFNSKYSIVK